MARLSESQRCPLVRTRRYRCQMSSLQLNLIYSRSWRVWLCIPTSIPPPAPSPPTGMAIEAPAMTWLLILSKYAFHVMNILSTNCDILIGA
jgi:hypothetical protein